MTKAEQLIKDRTRNCSNATVGWKDGESEILYHPWLTPENALRAVEIERKEVIEKALIWLDDHFYFNNLHYSVENNTFNCMEEAFDDLKEYLKGERL